MGLKSSSSTEDEALSTANTTVPSSPLSDEYSPFMGDEAIQQMRAEERAAKAENQRAQRKENDKLLKKKKSKDVTDSERKEQARQLEELLAKSAVGLQSYLTRQSINWLSGLLQCPHQEDTSARSCR